MNASRHASRIALISLLIAQGSLVPARGDLVRLHSGGEVRGTLLPLSPDSGDSTVRTRSGTLITVPSAEVDFVARRSQKIEEYTTRSRQIGHSIEEHLALAEWCRSEGLLDQRAEQLEQVLDLDPDHPEARKTLGFVRHLGRWMTQDDVMSERGYYRYQGRWVTRQQLEIIEKNAAQKSAESSWTPKIRTWVSWLTGNQAERQRIAVQELQSIRTGDAVPSLTQFMANHPVPDVRLLYVRILMQIDSPRALPPLVDQALMDVHEELRRVTMDHLIEKQADKALPFLINALKHRSNAVVNRAAVALGTIGDEKAVPALIDVLVTTHSFQREVVVPVPSQGPNMVATTIGPQLYPGIMPPNVEGALRTGQLPYGVKVVGGPTPQFTTQRITVAEEVKNLEVLEALEKITGKSFGFDERNWHLWWATTHS